jgi:hypothetical protein
VPGRYSDRQDSVLSRLRHLLPDGMVLAAVHRLDWETSGILLLARDRQTYRQLSRQFQERQVHKVYEAVLSGSVTADQGAIELPLWGDPENRPYQKVDEEQGLPSLTRFQVMAREGDCTRVKFMPLTGRTHQLRVHAADARGLGSTHLGRSPLWMLCSCKSVTFACEGTSLRASAIWANPPSTSKYAVLITPCGQDAAVVESDNERSRFISPGWISCILLAINNA